MPAAKKILVCFYSCFLAITLSLLYFVTPALGGDEGLLDELVRRQKSLESVHANFMQEKYDPMLGRPIKSTGDFYFRSGSGVRWEYEDALVIYDGSVLYVFSPETNEAEKIKGGQNFMGPLAFDIKELVKQYNLDAIKDGDAIVLRLTPKGEMPFESMEMLFEAKMAFPKVVKIDGTAGDTTTIEFENIKVNAKFGSDLFVFSPSPGTIVRERQFE